MPATISVLLVETFESLTCLMGEYRIYHHECREGRHNWLKSCFVCTQQGLLSWNRCWSGLSRRLLLLLRLARRHWRVAMPQMRFYVRRILVTDCTTNKFRRISAPSPQDFVVAIAIRRWYPAGYPSYRDGSYALLLFTHIFTWYWKSSCEREMGG